MATETRNNQQADRRRKRVPRHEQEMTMMEHLAELRIRLFRAIIMIALGSVFVWYYFDPLYTFFTEPIKPYLKSGGDLMVTSWIEPFFIHMRLALYGGLVVSAPFWVMELWGFVSPALTPEERRPLRIIAPMTVVLFAMGVTLAHLILPMTFQWAMGYLPPGARLMQSVNGYVEFLAKMYLAFGLSFQLPIALMFLARVGLIDAGLMRLYWRHAVIVIMLIAAIITPSNDPVTMSVCAAPMGFLYLLSIYLVEWMSRDPATQAARAHKRRLFRRPRRPE
jgi:sec-independent protein translocase protein TatC